MHPREIARRAGEASDRISKAALAIGDSLGLDAPNFTQVASRGGPVVMRLRERELQADYLEAIAEKIAKLPKKGSAKKQDEDPAAAALVPAGVAQSSSATDDDDPSLRSSSDDLSPLATDDDSLPPIPPLVIAGE